MSNGRVLGPWKSSAKSQANRIMAMAKDKGARIRTEDAYRDYLKDLYDEEARAQESQLAGEQGGRYASIINKFITPLALGALGLGTGGIGNLALAALMGTGMSAGSTSIGDMLARQFKHGGGLFQGKQSKLMKEIPDFADYYKGDKNAYSRKYLREASGKATDITEDLREKQDFYLKELKRSRTQSAILDGLLATAAVKGQSLKAEKDALKKLAESGAGDVSKADDLVKTSLQGREISQVPSSPIMKPTPIEELSGFTNIDYGPVFGTGQRLTTDTLKNMMFNPYSELGQLKQPLLTKKSSDNYWQELLSKALGETVGYKE